MTTKPSNYPAHNSASTLFYENIWKDQPEIFSFSKEEMSQIILEFESVLSELESYRHVLASAHHLIALKDLSNG